MSGQKKLTQTTIVSAPPGSASAFAVYGPESEDIPDWALEQMGDHLFEEPTSAPDPEAQLAAQSKAADAADGSGGEPPRAGRGSGLEAWSEYAVGLGIEVPEDASRDDVIELVDAYVAPSGA